MKIIYIACPAYVGSGGPEALHQLLYKLRTKFQVKAYIFYFDYNFDLDKSPVNQLFSNYVNEYWVTSIIEDKSSVLLIPEGYPELFRKYFKIKKIVWWLSVDNFFKIEKKTNPFNFFFKTHSIFNQIKLFISILYRNKIAFHFTQSYYAYNFLSKFGIRNVFYLSDYISPYFIDKCLIQELKKDIVLFNPAKGYDFTKKLIEFDKKISWFPLSNLKLSELQSLMKTAKMYVDFGSHPGKDRIPREAVLCGCVIFTSKNGSAKNIFDIPISDNYKFNSKKSNIESIIENINSVLQNYDSHKNNFEYYKNIIVKQEELFEKEITNLISLLKLKEAEA